MENFYDDFLIKFKEHPINFMEIGVYNGGSIKLWKDYLHKDSIIYASDINYFEHINGTYSFIGDMYSNEQVSKFSDEYRIRIESFKMFLPTPHSTRINNIDKKFNFKFRCLAIH